MLLPLVLFACTHLLPSTTPPAVCGDGEWSAQEACDPMEAVYGPWCTASCVWNTCGDTVVGPDETCDPPSLYGTCGPTCQSTTCGSGVPDLGELCLESLAVVPVGAGAADIALTDADADGDADLLVAAPGGAWLWFNDAGKFTRSALVIPGAGTVAVAALGRTLLALNAERLAVGHYYGLSHQIVTYPLSVPNAHSPCTAPRPGSLSVGRMGVTQTATWICEEGAFEVFVAERGAPVRADAGLTLPGGAASYAVVEVIGNEPRLWTAHPEEPWLSSNSPPAELPLPSPARAIRPPFGPEDRRPELVVQIDDAVVFANGRDALRTLATPGIVDGTAGWWNDAGVEVPSGLDAVYADADGLVIHENDTLPHRGPALPGLTRVLVSDLDGDGHLDLVALRPAAGEVHVWRQNP